MDQQTDDRWRFQGKEYHSISSGPIPSKNQEDSISNPKHILQEHLSLILALQSLSSQISTDLIEDTLQYLGVMYLRSNTYTFFFFLSFPSQIRIYICLNSFNCKPSHLYLLTPLILLMDPPLSLAKVPYQGFIRGPCLSLDPHEQLENFQKRTSLWSLSLLLPSHFYCSHPPQVLINFPLNLDPSLLSQTPYFSLCPIRRERDSISTKTIFSN